MARIPIACMFSLTLSLALGAASLFVGCATNSPMSDLQSQGFMVPNPSAQASAIEAPGLINQRDKPMFTESSLHTPAAVDSGAVAAAKALSEEIWVIEAANAAGEKVPSCIGTLSVRDAAGKPSFLPSKPLLVQPVLTATVATVRLSQEFENNLEQSAEGEFSLALPREATPTDFLLTLGRRRIRAMVSDRATAGKIFDAAKAAHLPAVFSKAGAPLVLSLGKIQPGRDIAVSIQYIQPLPVVNGVCTFTLNSGDKLPATRPAGPGIELDLSLTPGMTVEKIDSTLPLTQNEPPKPYHVKAMYGNGNDYKLAYTLAGKTPKATLLSYRDSSGLYYAFSVVAPVDAPATGLTISSTQLGSIKVPDIAKGSSALIIGRLAADKSIQLVPILSWNNGQSSITPAVLELPNLPTLWARAQYNALPANDAKRAKLALDYSLLTPETAILAVDTVGK